MPCCGLEPQTHKVVFLKPGKSYLLTGWMSFTNDKLS
jgi:hypothetical protein